MGSRSRSAPTLRDLGQATTPTGRAESLQITVSNSTLGPSYWFSSGLGCENDVTPGPWPSIFSIAPPPTPSHCLTSIEGLLCLPVLWIPPSLPRTSLLCSPSLHIISSSPLLQVLVINLETQFHILIFGQNPLLTPVFPANAPTSLRPFARKLSEKFPRLFSPIH